jgi:hypothetical protein
MPVRKIRTPPATTWKAAASKDVSMTEAVHRRTVSIQFTPNSSARWIEATESLSFCFPQPDYHPEFPMAHDP